MLFLRALLIACLKLLIVLGIVFWPVIYGLLKETVTISSPGFYQYIIMAALVLSGINVAMSISAIDSEDFVDKSGIMLMATFFTVLLLHLDWGMSKQGALVAQSNSGIRLWMFIYSVLFFLYLNVELSSQKREIKVHVVNMYLPEWLNGIGWLGVRLVTYIFIAGICTFFTNYIWHYENNVLNNLAVFSTFWGVTTLAGEKILKALKLKGQ